MNFGSANSATVDPKTSGHNNQGNGSIRSNSGSGFRRIMEKGRLTEEDLELFHSNILEAHKKRHYRILVISAILFVCLGTFIYYLI